MISNYDYYCPHCNHQLTADDQISFFVRTARGEMANLQLSAVPGEYGYMADKDLEIKEGDEIEFNCQRCQNNLKSNTYPDFVEIHLRVTTDVIFEVLFSPICGEKVTYVIMEGEMVKYQENFYSITSTHRKSA
jgi:transcription elongation factor Elf1